ncbi:glycosyltransferase [Sulfuracidifex metallicus]|uniref:Glycosyltransferase n=1 Tax=Sulfuracidifex metallicus DSM 6482 = JCM 9184 TaxID=523847 RepID=A0A6A9QVR9_SULME|nr:glycosyltransferase [Sulfuracidifex metallicus]MUN29152.1 glycosyltransferase [Sulfuracidifex metallicus DSM 6482 = JCM 9184]
MIEKYASVVGEQEIDGIVKIAEKLKGVSVLHVNSTKAGGGVAEILNRMVPLMKDLGINVDWKIIRGDSEFFNVTKSFHNSLQNGTGSLNDEQFKIYDKWQEINSTEVPLDYDVMFIHDPQPAGLVKYKKNNTWIWRCHIDISNPFPPVWKFLSHYVSQYKSMIVSVPSFGRDDLDIPQFVIPPSIDPLSIKNGFIHDVTVRRVLRKYEIDENKPIITQVSRFDRAKDPIGVIRAFKLTRAHVDSQLVYVGSPASDDPEGEIVYKEVVKEVGDEKDIHLLMLPAGSDLEINAFQRASAVVMQKSIKEGFGLTVSEAMWKQRPVIGGNTGGIPLQVIHGITGYLVDSVEGASHYMTFLLKNKEYGNVLGARAKEHVRQNFLITRELRDYLLTILYSMGKTL